jgi:hypothetical protein
MAEAHRRPDGFMAVLIGPDNVVLDRKFFSAHGAAIKYVTVEGLDAIEGDVASAEIWSPAGELVWYKINAKVEDQVRAAAIATHNAGLYWEGRPASTPQSEMLCDDCQKVTMHYVDSVEGDKYNTPWLRKRRTRCKECGREKIGERIPLRPKR